MLSSSKVLFKLRGQGQGWGSFDNRLRGGGHVGTPRVMWRLSIQAALTFALCRLVSRLQVSEPNDTRGVPT